MNRHSIVGAPPCGANISHAIISISRRTDIPAFYGDWFMRRVAEGFVGWENPFGGRRRRVSLRRADVRCLAFWSKNFRPFLPHLRTLQTLDYPCFFNYTITGLPSVFETHTVPAEDAVDSLRDLAHRFSPEHINWRYDPIILSERTPPDYHRTRFAGLAAALQGSVTRCIVSFVWRYSKVERNFAALERAQDFRIFDPDVAARRRLAEQLAAIAAAHGIALHSCCGDDLLSSPRPGVTTASGPALPAPIRKAHCLDGEAISRLYPGVACRAAAHPTRPECGCAANVDIGRYDTCPHGCVYCYANVNKTRADACHRAHDPDSAFLGYTKAESDELVAELREEENRKSSADSFTGLLAQSAAFLLF
jgi:hypothetical protein